MMTHLLIAALAVGLIAIALIQAQHISWVRREFEKNTLAHKRLVALREPVPTHAPFPLEHRDWADDRLATQAMRPSQYPPIDFRYKGW